MFVLIFHSLTSLLLGGAFCYAVFVSERLRAHRLTQQALIGFIFGTLVISLGLSTFILEPFGVRLDAKAGPLIFAGYLGGPIGALVAGISSALFGLSQDVPLPVLDVFMNLAIPAIGLIVGYLFPPRDDWPVTSGSAVGALLVGYVALHIVPFLVAGSGNATNGGYLFAVTIGAVFGGVAIISILVTWLFLNHAAGFASQAARSRELSKRLDLTLQHSNMGLIEQKIGASGAHFDAGSVALFGLGLEPGLVPTAVWEDAIHPDDKIEVQAGMQRAIIGEANRDWVDFRLIKPDGQLRYIRAQWSVERDQEGRATRIIGLHSDLTDIRKAEQNHLESVERLALIAENLPGVVFQSDITDRGNPQLKYISPKCQLLWGYSDEEFYNDDSLFYQAHDPEDIPRFLAALEKGIATDTPVLHRYQITARDGSLRWLDYRGGSRCFADGRVVIEAIVLDVTRVVEVQEQIEREREIVYRAQKNESIGQLTGGVAHDFNNLLAVILGNLELLNDINEPATQRELIDAAITATLRGAELTKNMLAFARKARLEPEVLDLNNVVREAKNWMGRTLPESVSVETSLLAGLWPIEADRSSLESALLNLILNARDAMTGQGNLTIETANIRIDVPYIDSRQEELAPGRYVMLAVSDTGAGISKDNLASIFEPFFTTKPPGSGSGLGLSMTVGFMKQSGGTIQVYTETGAGTTFKLYFPVTTTIADRPSRPALSKTEMADGGQRVLVAEDEEAVREILVTILERAGYLVTETVSGDDAFAVFDADPTFDLLLTDIVMPGKLQGTDLARVLRQRWVDLPVIFMSGYASEATVHGNGLRPEDIRLMKPVQRADLLIALTKALQLPKD